MRIVANVPVKSRVRQLCGRMRQPANVKSAGEATSTVGLVTELHLPKAALAVGVQKRSVVTWGM